MYVPLLGRLALREWLLLVLSFSLAWLEFIISIITQFLPSIVIQFFTSTTLVLYRFTSNPINLIYSMTKQTNDNEPDEVRYRLLNYRNNPRVNKESYDLMTDLLNSNNIKEMCQFFGYDIESRILKTDDNYFLTIQRISKPNSFTRRNGKVVYLHHGLLMSSEIWVTMLDKNLNLPFLLYDLGYDVWLGNNRGNKYSQKHLFHAVNSEKFWDFSMDEFALFDIPNSINFILEITGKKKLTYIGFSQGTAQAFASVSINPELNDKIDKIIAISPATTPHGLYSKFLDIFLKASPHVVFLLFSRKILMPSVLFWKRIMYPPLFDTSIDISNYLLFNWRSENIEKIQKLSSYAHLYLATSVKTVVHWFQIISSKNFQMYHDSKDSAIYPMSYPLKTIRIPIHLIYGTIDSLVDIDVMKRQLPEKYTTTQPVANHEHLDNLWGADIGEKVFRYVLEYLEEPELFDVPLLEYRSQQNYLQTSPNAINGVLEDDYRNPLKGNSYSEELEADLSHRRPSTGGSVFL